MFAMASHARAAQAVERFMEKTRTELQVSSHRLERLTKMPSLMLRPVSDRRIGKNFAGLVKA